jgi:hypothetical protein
MYKWSVINPVQIRMKKLQNPIGTLEYRRTGATRHQIAPVL